ncbi:MAG: hypothetical protein EOP46_17460 [Sphingobacteriaceae bacterium]|nr:MAG: hypothetical protein EOP46_17460 [Sphingobacteriaceae bacterium]
MKLFIKPKALKVINAAGSFVESKNTPGGGARFILKFIAAIEKVALPDVEYALCNHHLLASKAYSCTHFNKWVIAFKIGKSALTVYEIIPASILA